MSELKNKKIFNVIIGSPVDYNNLVAYISLTERPLNSYFRGGSNYKDGDTVVDNDEVAILHQEEGKGKIKIKFSDYVVDKELYVDDLLAAIIKAKEALMR